MTNYFVLFLIYCRGFFLGQKQEKAVRKKQGTTARTHGSESTRLRDEPKGISKHKGDEHNHNTVGRLTGTGRRQGRGLKSKQITPVYRNKIYQELKLFMQGAATHTEQKLTSICIHVSFSSCF